MFDHRGFKSLRLNAEVEIGALRFPVAPGAVYGNTLFMDEFISVCVVPIGVLICFGPALIFWIVAELKDPSNQPNKK